MNYLPHSVCLRDDRFLIALHMFSDALIALTYLLIPLITLVLIVRIRESAKFREFLLSRSYAFSALPTIFVLACGGGHFLAMLTFVYPMYRAEGWWKLITAAIGLASAVILGGVAFHDYRNS